MDRESRIVLAGSCENADGHCDLLELRSLSDGTPDSGCGSGGVFMQHGAAGAGGSDGGFALAIESLDRIVVAGRSTDGTDNDPVARRLNP